MNQNEKKENCKENERLFEPSPFPFSKWKRWGPYVSERSWGTVREDYSPNGDAWNYFPHDHARSRAYRWGEDGIAGFCDRYQLLVLAHSFWNGKDPILKERMFGLTHDEGNHGEDVKEYYYYLDGTPTHSYAKFLYKYPQKEYPYVDLIEKNKERSLLESEYELIDTGIFENNEYFDIFIEYAKADTEDICIKIEIHNRAEKDASLDVIPQLWFRNKWTWTKLTKKPILKSGNSLGYMQIVADDNDALLMPNLPFPYKLGIWYLYAQEGGELLFTDNETNNERIFSTPSVSKYTKDAFHRHIVQKENSVNPEKTGTKACVHYKDVLVSAKDKKVIYLRLTNTENANPFQDIETVFADRKKETDEFYETIYPPLADVEEKQILRQSLAGMLLSKQIYLFDVKKWLAGDDPDLPPPESRKKIRNQKWGHLNSMRVLSIPDKWEYPWFAAWDLAFHCIPLAMIDISMAKDQLWYLLFEQFQHPNGQIPAYEWEFSDLNPPIHAYAVLKVYQMEKQTRGVEDLDFLERCFHKLLINFAWWVNRVDKGDNNIFEGGFLGLDNITVVERSSSIPGGATLEQSDATGWMGMYCLNLMRIALELARKDKAYEWLATKFFQHFAYIGTAMKHMGGREQQLWDEKDGFFYDILSYPNGKSEKFRVRSLVGLIPIFAAEVISEKELAEFPNFRSNFFWFLENRKEMSDDSITPLERNGEKNFLLTVVNKNQLTRLLSKIGDEDEFKSDFGLRSLSKFHEKHPFVFGDSKIGYEPGISYSRIKGGNSNWRGPIWFPTTFMMIEALKLIGNFYEDTLHIPTRDGNISLFEIAKEFAEKMIRIFKIDSSGKRPVFGDNEKFQTDPNFKDYLLFYEYFNGDTGEGLGASHQTGWTGLVATLIKDWKK